MEVENFNLYEVTLSFIQCVQVGHRSPNPHHILSMCLELILTISLISCLFFQYNVMCMAHKSSGRERVALTGADIAILFTGLSKYNS